MEFLRRKVYLTKSMVPHDSNGDGVMDMLVISATTKILQIPLTQTIDDMGVFNIYDQEEVDIIDIGGFINETITPDDIKQPPTPPDTTTIVWDGGGQSNATQQEIFYCNDKTANNYQYVETRLVNGINFYVLVTPVSGELEETVYGPSINGVYPKFITDSTLCRYNLDLGSGNVDININTQAGGTGIQTISHTESTLFCDWVTNSSWDSYKTTALSLANTHCKNINNDYSVIDGSTLPSGYIEGDCVNTSTVFGGVKLKSQSKGYCDDIGENRYKYEFCFYCF